MKAKLIIVLLLTGLLFSCAKDEEIGPQGPKGDVGAPGQNGQNGTDGQDGTDGAPGAPGTSANVWTYIYSNQRINANTPGILDPATGRYIFHGTKEYLPANYEKIQNTGVVLVYFRMSGAGKWQLGSYQIEVGSEATANNGTVQLTYSQDQKSVNVQSQFSALLDSGAEMQMAQFDVKVILIESSAVTISSLRSKVADLEIGAIENYLKSMVRKP